MDDWDEEEDDILDDVYGEDYAEWESLDERLAREEEEKEIEMMAEAGTILEKIEEEEKMKELQGGCFIATACFGSYDHPFVKVLRQFRDEFLLTNRVGNAFVRWYYKHSPTGAKFLNKYGVLKIPVLLFILPLVLEAYFLLHHYLTSCVLELWSVVKKQRD